MLNIIKRKYCIVCNNKLVKFKKIKNFPIYMSSVDKKDYTFYDMNWKTCINCGCVQLSNLIEPSQLYIQPHNASIGKTWENHNLLFSNIVNTYFFENILDIGGANLRIANLLCQNRNVKKYTVLDYSSNKYNISKIDDKITMIVGDAEKINLNYKFDCIVMSHTFEHLYEPVKFLLNVRNLIKEDGKFIISIPNIKNQLLNGFLNALNFEHTFYIDDYYIEKIFEFAGFQLEKNIKFSEYNSFYVFKKNNNILSEQNMINYQQDSNESFNIFFNFLKKDVKKLNLELKNKEFYIFGAHIFSQYLINFGLNIDNAINIIDNDPNKENKYLYGSNIIVKNPEIIKNISNPIVIVRVAQYKQEIEEQLRKLNKNVKIL